MAQENEIEITEIVEMEVVSPVQRLLSFLRNNNNIAPELDEHQLTSVALQVKKDFNEDLDSMEDWINFVEQGQNLMSQEFQARAKPWDGAANFKSPVILNAVLQFGDTASQELLRKPELVKAMVLGRDPDGQKENQGENASEYMNYQLNVQMPEWRPEHDRLLYTLPSTGCMFKKTFYDNGSGRNFSDVIFYPNYVVNQSNITIEDAKSFTQIMQFTENEVIEKQRKGEWSQVDLQVRDENLSEQPEENTDRFFEQHSWFDLDGDGYKEPYIVTMHEATNTIVRIVPRFMVQDIMVRAPLDQIVPLTQLLDAGITPDEIVSIKPLNLLTKYDFLPDPKGEFLGIGYPHLMAGVTQGLNTVTNQLLDAGKLANLPGGYLAKGVRKKLGEDRFQPGEWKITNVPPRDLGNSFFPLPFKEPSSTLFNLNEKLQAEAQRTSASADFSKVLANNAPATTTLALLQKETQSTTSIIRRVYLAMSQEFKKMAVLNQRFTDPTLYKIILGDEKANFEQDFDTTTINYVPIANPEMSTRIERVKASEVQLSFLPQIVEAGGNAQVVIKGFLDALGVENIDAIFPEPLPEQIEQQNQLMMQQNQLSQFQNELFDRELRVREADLQRKVAETQSKISELRAQVLKIHADAVLTLEKAETEDQVNQITVYTTELQTLMQMLTTLTQAQGNANNVQQQNQ